MISEYSKIIPLERHSNEDAKYFAAAMDKVGHRMEQNYSTIQAYTDQLAGIDMLRASDKTYLDEKLNGMIDNLNKLGTVNLNSTSSVLKAKKALAEVTKDERILTAAQETKYVRDIQNQWREVQKNPKLSKNWNSDNYSYDMNLITDYINSDDPISRVGIQHASLYGGENEALAKLGKETKATSQDFVSGISKMTVKRTNGLTLYGQADSIPGLDRQSQIEYAARKRANPNIDNEYGSNIPKYIEQSRNNLKQLEKAEEAAREGEEITNADGTKTRVTGYKNYYNDAIALERTRLARLEAIDALPADRKGLEAYKESKKIAHVNAFQSEESKYGVNESVKEQFAMNHLASKFKLDANKVDLEYKYKAQALNSTNQFREGQLSVARYNAETNRMNAATNATNAATKASSSKSGSGTGGADSTNLEDTLILGEGQVEPKSHLEHLLEEDTNLNTQYADTLSSLVNLMGNLSTTEKDSKKIFTDKLKAKGFSNYDFNKLEKVNPANMSPKAIEDIGEAMAIALAASGESNLTSSGQRAVQHLMSLTELANKKKILDLKNAYSETGMDKSWSEDKKRKHKENNLQIFGTPLTHSRVVNLEAFKDNAAIRTGAQGIVNNTPTLMKDVDGKEVYFYRGATNPFTGSDRKGATQIAPNKVTPVSIDPTRNRIYVDVEVGKGEEKMTERMYYRMVPEEMKRLVESGGTGLYNLATNNNLSAEDLLKSLPPAIRNQYLRDTDIQTIGGRSLGLPDDVLLNYTMNMDNDGTVSFKIYDSAGKPHLTYKYANTAALRTTLANSYNVALQQIKANYPNKTDREHHTLANKQVIDKILFNR